MRFRFIRVEKEWFPITALCRVLDVSCSGYHAWAGRAPSQRSTANAFLAVEIAAVFTRSRKTYGSPRVHAELSSLGTHAGRHRIARIMHDSSLRARKKRSFKHTTDSRFSQRIAHNVLNRTFSTDAPNQVWVTDVKAIRTGEGWLYLAAVIDLFSRRVIGHSMSDCNDTALALRALNDTLRTRGTAHGVLHHSDRGCTYASDQYHDRLSASGICPSMSRSGNCWDNAVAESFFSTLEWELLARNSFATQSQAHRAVSEYIDQFFNPIRRHSTNGYLSPIAYELRWQSRQLAV